MHVVRVIALAALPNTVPQVLDYFWTAPLPQGALVSTTVGRRTVTALVLESLDVQQAKLAVKKASFGLKKLSGIIVATPQATTGQLAMAQWLARQYHAPLGLCAKTVLPPWLGKRRHILEIAQDTTERTEKKIPIAYILTQPDTAIKEIRERCAHAIGQVLILVPEKSLAEHLGRELHALSPVLVHSDIGVREHAAAYRTVLSGTDTVVIGTRLALFLPWRHLCQVIMEDSLNEAYKSDMTPRYAAADAARQLCQIYGASLTYLSPALSTANRYLADKKVFALSDKKPYWPKVFMADMTLEQQEGNRSVLSRRAQEVLLDSHGTRQRLLLFSPRRAFATSLVCQRCRQSILCATCDIPMRVHAHTEQMLVCYHCAAYTALPKQCLSCHAGPLKSSGIAGSQKIAQAVNECLDRHGLAKLPIAILDSDLSRSDADEREVLERLDISEPQILVATQLVFGHRYERAFDHIIIVGADALAYNPDFRTQERLIYQLEKLADFRPKTMAIQYWDDRGAISRARDRSWNGFYERELAERKALGWPPFCRIVKLTFSHRDRSQADRAGHIAADRLKRATAHLGNMRTTSILGPTPALVERSGGRWSQHIVIKTTAIAERLSDLLSHVPAGWTIDIDPRSIT